MKFKAFIFALFLLQVAFSLSYRAFTHSGDLFPIFDWKIFHSRPDKYVTLYYISVSQIDKESFLPPTELRLLRERFRGLNLKKVDHLARSAALSHDPKVKAELISRISSQLEKHHETIQWTIRGRLVDPLAFMSSGEIEEDFPVE